MRKVICRLLLLLFVAASAPARSQVNKSAEKFVKLTARYNDYLSSVGLSCIIVAAGVELEANVPLLSANGQALKSRYILHLVPSATFNNPLSFNDHWLQLLEQARPKTALYEELFFKFCSISGISPDSTAINISTSRPEIFSVTVYLENGVKTVGNTAKPKSFQPVLDFPGAVDLNNGLLGMIFRNVPVKSNPAPRLLQIIERFLKNGSNKQQKTMADVVSKSWGEGIFLVVANGINGRVTGRYNELIQVDLTVVPSADRKTADIGVSFTVYFASGTIDTRHLENYENALKSYKTGLNAFSTDLRKVIANALYDKKL